MTRAYAAELAAAVDAARAAGAILREELHRPGGPRGAHGHAPVDEIAEAAIRARLPLSEHGYLGEETGEAGVAASAHRWIVDPNDGTTAFLRGLRGSAVSIALVREATPVLGVVFAYAAPDDEGDLFSWAEGGGPLVRNGRALDVDLRTRGLAGALVAVSPDADLAAEANLRCVTPARYLPVASLAYRLALTAAGVTVAAVSLSASRSWDYAGGDALVRASHGVVADERGATVRYDARGRSSTARTFGGAASAVATLIGRPWEDVRKR